MTFLARDTSLDCVIQHVSEPIHLTLSVDGMYAGKFPTTMGNFEYQSTCGIYLNRRKEVLSAPRVLLVLMRSFKVSLRSLDVFFVSEWCVVLCLFGFFVAVF